MLRHNHAFLCGRIKKIFCFQLCPSSYYLWRYQVATELHVCTNVPIFIETFGKVKCDAYFFKNWALNVMLSKHHNWVWSMLCLQASQLAKEMLCLESITIGYDQCYAYRHHNWPYWTWTEPSGHWSQASKGGLSPLIIYNSDTLYPPAICLGTYVIR